jgi:hypothetical protein
MEKVWGAVALVVSMIVVKSAWLGDARLTKLPFARSPPR